MKTLTLLALLLGAPLASAEPLPKAPSEDACNKPAAAKRLQRAVIAEIRAKMAEEQAEAFSFKFTNVWRPQYRAPDLAVYFERISQEGKRQGYTAQYAVDAKSCAPTLKKLQRLVPGTDASPEILDDFRDSETCNYADGQEKIRAATLRAMKWLHSQTMPGSTVGNFSFTSVKRVDGTSDVLAFFEVSRPGLATTPIIAYVQVDAATCEASVPASTSFGWLHTTY